MRDVEAYGRIIEEFITRMTSPDMGQFKLEVPTFRIILKTSQKDRPILNKLEITDDGELRNIMDDTLESLEGMSHYFSKCMEFFGSLVGDELSKDIVMRTMEEPVSEIKLSIRNPGRITGYLPRPLGDIVISAPDKKEKNGDHDELLEIVKRGCDSYLERMGEGTDLSAFKLKLGILREDHELLRGLSINKNRSFEFDSDVWSRAKDEEVRDAVVAIVNSLVGLASFLIGRTDSLKMMTSILREGFRGKEGVLDRYGLTDALLDGALHTRLSTGLPSLDGRLKGGIPKGHSILLLSQSGVERDLLLANILNKAVEEGSSILWVSSKEPAKSVRSSLRSVDLSPEDLEETERLRIVDWFSWRSERIIGVERDGYSLKSSKILSNLGIAINKSLRDLAYTNTKIAVVHIIGAATNIFDFSKVYNFIQRLRAKFKEEEMTAFFLLEPDVLSVGEEGKISEVFDGCMTISKKTSEGSDIRREITILTLEGVDFDTRPFPFEIEDNLMIDVEFVKKSGPIRPRIKTRKAKRVEGPEEDIPELEEITDSEVEELEEITDSEVEELEEELASKSIRPDFVIMEGETDSEKVRVSKKVKRKMKSEAPEAMAPVPRRKNTVLKRDSVPRKVTKRVTRKRVEGEDYSAEVETILNEAMDTIDSLLAGSDENRFGDLKAEKVIVRRRKL